MMKREKKKEPTNSPLSGTAKKRRCVELVSKSEIISRQNKVFRSVSALYLQVG